MKSNVFVINGCSNHSVGERQRHDYYATEPKAVELLLGLEELSNTIVEPCCGEGHISKVLEQNNYKVYSSDLIDRGYGIGERDLFKYHLNKHGYLCYEDEIVIANKNFDIVTNPPYKQVKAFTEHMLTLLNDNQKLILFLKLTFMESQSRRKLFNENPFKKLYVASKRLNAAKNGDFEKYKSNAVAYGWFVWKKGFKGNPIIEWFN